MITRSQMAQHLKIHARIMSKIADTFGDEDLKQSVDEAFAQLTRTTGLVQQYDFQELSARMRL